MVNYYLQSIDLFDNFLPVTKGRFKRGGKYNLWEEESADSNFLPVTKGRFKRGGKYNLWGITFPDYSPNINDFNIILQPLGPAEGSISFSSEIGQLLPLKSLSPASGNLTFSSSPIQTGTSTPIRASGGITITSEIGSLIKTTAISIKAEGNLTFSSEVRAYNLTPIKANGSLVIESAPAKLLPIIPISAQGLLNVKARVIAQTKDFGKKLFSQESQLTIQSQVSTLVKLKPLSPGSSKIFFNSETGKLLPIKSLGKASSSISFSSQIQKPISKPAIPLGTPKHLREIKSGWNNSKPITQEISVESGKPKIIERVIKISYDIFQPISQIYQIVWNENLARKLDFSIASDQFEIRSIINRVPWNFPIVRDTEHGIPWEPQIARNIQQNNAIPWNQIPQKSRITSIAFKKPAPVAIQYAIPWGDFTINNHKCQVWAILWSPHVSRQINPEWKLPDGNQPSIKDDPNVPPTKPTYPVMSDINIVRLPERTEIHASSVKLNSDIDSWAWQINLIPLSQSDYELLSPDATGPQEIEININGYQWIGIIEKINQTKRFAETTFSASGRSRSAYLSAPYSIARDFSQSQPRNLQQLANEELDNTGWTLIWNTVNFLVPGGVFSYQNKTPMSVMLYITETIDATIQTHPNEAQLIVSPRHPVSSWQWPLSEPDSVLPRSMIYQQGVAWNQTPAYNKIYCVGGKSGGILAGVKRAGTAGEVLAPQFVHDLLTNIDGGREKARNVLSQAGKKRTFTIETSLLPGLLLPKTLLEVEGENNTSWIGQVMSCSISTDGLAIRQHIEVDRYV